MGSLKLVVVESPFSSGTTPPILAVEARNLRYVRAAMRDCLQRKEAPFPSHALYTQPGVLDDHDPEERRLGMEAGFAWGAAGDLVAVYLDLGWSRGMREGVRRATERGTQVEERRLGGAWAECVSPFACGACTAEYGNGHAYYCPMWRAV